LLVFWTPVRLRPAPPLWGCNWNSTGYDNDKNKITCGGNSQKVANKQLAITNYQWLLKRNKQAGVWPIPVNRNWPFFNHIPKYTPSECDEG